MATQMSRRHIFLSNEGENKQFDAAFLGISALEASVLDPQIRLLLETVYEALEAGGQTIDQLRGTNTAVYADRPHYFEAHGTGTRTGDPIEAEAIKSAFFPDSQICGSRIQTPLLVGSIKTVVGHTEGTAGIAGILKASLALQNSIIPPNLLFKKLNRAIEPFYHGLQIPTSAMPWPSTSSHSPRRVSVNSFGFGGTNAHAILESYVPHDKNTLQVKTTIEPVTLPFVFSAASEASLRFYLNEFCKFLRTSEDGLNLRDITFSLSARRTRFPVAMAVAASTPSGLCKKIEGRLHEAQADEDHLIGVRNTRSHETSPQRRQRVLGVFTGQGAQWAQMGWDLIQASAAPRKTIERLQARLDSLPPGDRPSWSILGELAKDASSSRIMDAEVSQTLCTAVQIIQVDLIRAAELEMSVVVGHSSGEIAAAYAANLITVEAAAICIAYYRGLYAKVAKGTNGKSGAMMVVATSQQDAEELLRFPEFDGRACIAAVNSGNSVTLSGDHDAIEELRIIFKDEDKSVKVLEVDTAYHSHHMRAASCEYLRSLLALNLQIGGGGRVAWVSSVYGSVFDGYDLLHASYGRKNLCQPVLFLQAMECAFASMGPFDLIVELGPHPALKGPTLQIAEEQTSLGSPYTSLRHQSIKLRPTLTGILTSSAPGIFKALPKYAWDHKVDYWHESRYARATRLRPAQCTNCWVISPRTAMIRICGGAKYYGSPKFRGWPDIGCKTLWSFRPRIRLMEILDMRIVSALMFDPEDFKYHASTEKAIDKLELKSHGRIRIQCGKACAAALPIRSPERCNLLPVDEDRFYEMLSDLEYQYGGPFRALWGLKRRLGAASAYVSLKEPSSLPIHPAALDAAFQSLSLTYATPDDGSQTTMYLPKAINRITVNPAQYQDELCEGRSWALDVVQPLALPHLNMVGDIDIYSNDSGHAMVQIQGLECAPFSQRTTSDGDEVFSKVSWGLAHPSIPSAVASKRPIPDALELATILERLASFHLRLLDTSVPESHPCRREEPYIGLFEFAANFGPSARDSQYCHVDWQTDTPQTLNEICKPFTETVDMQLLSDFGANIYGIATGDKSPVGGSRQSRLMEWYTTGVGIAECTTLLAKAMGQIVHRYPQMHILEFGTDSGTAAAKIFQEIGSKHSDLAKDLGSQGFSKGAFDVVVTSLTLHKQADLGQWDDLLLNNGFSGIDTSATEVYGAAHYSVFASQAVDECIMYLRDPLSHPFPSLRKGQKPMKDLVILGGEIPTTRCLSGSVSEALRPYYCNIKSFDSLSDILDIEVISGADILSLADLDTSVFGQLDQISWDAVKKMVLHTGTVMWLSHGRLAMNPHTNMMVGLIRGAVRDNPGLDYLLLDTENIQMLNHRVIATSLLQYKAATQWLREGTIQQFSAETGQVLDDKGSLLTPRLGDSVLIHEASPESASVFSEEAKSLGVDLTFTTTNPQAANLCDERWTLVHPACPHRDIARIANRGFSAFLNLASPKDDDTVAGRIASALPKPCKQYGQISSPGEHRLLKAVSNAVRALTETDARWLDYQVPLLPIGAVTEDASGMGSPVVVQWATSSSLSVKVEPVDKLVSFSGSKTYWLVGLVGGLGMSLCEWMIERGAKHFVMSSRKPSVSKSWLGEMRGRGAKLVVATCDVTHKDEVMVLFSRIESTMPAIGVAHGVMVLQDTNIRDMTLQQLLSVTKPKVDGSIHLNEALKGIKLDFFTGGFARTSERDFHQLFGEAVLAGRFDSTGPIELVSGIRKVDEKEAEPPAWLSWPRMSHFVEACKADEPMARPRPNLCSQKCGPLELSHINKTELGGMRLDRMGMDSLTAVEIRGWFMKTLEVNIPVLKVMNGGTVGDLVTTATDSIPLQLLPSLEDRSSGSSNAMAPAALSTERSTRFAPEGPQATSNGLAILKSIPISPTQSRFYPSGLFLEDKVGLNHTTWAKVTGRIEVERLKKAVEALGQQHEILRTAFFNHDGKQLQHILQDTTLHLEHQEIHEAEDVERIAMSIQKSYVYDLGQGDTMRLILLTRADETYLIAGLHPLVADATSIPTILKWLSLHYEHPNADFPVKQFSEAAHEQLELCATGHLDAERDFWRREFATMPPPLPLMSMAAVEERPVLTAYENVRAGCRIGPGLKAKVLDSCRRMQATPFQFYLAALRALLLQFSTGAEDVTIAVAESGRSYDANDMDVIGPLYNLVLVRTLADASTKFEDLLAVTRDKVLAALKHSRLPYPVLVEELGLQRRAKSFPFFQVFADYRMGQRETTQWGADKQVIMMGIDLNVPYDVYLDTIDEAGARSTYTASWDAEWSIGNTFHGGCVVAIIHHAAVTHLQAQPALKQPDILNLHVEFLRACERCDSTITVSTLKTGAVASTFQVELRQKTEIKAVALVTSTSFDRPPGPTVPTAWAPLPPPRPKPDFARDLRHQPDPNWVPAIYSGEVIPFTGRILVLGPREGFPVEGICDAWNGFEGAERIDSTTLAFMTGLITSMSDTLLRNGGLYDAHAFQEKARRWTEENPGVPAPLTNSLTDATKATTLN
ncbi:beta-ketoacyl synthase domain-containing protein [Apiospora phragmitis]|uniref:Beta-ketoacyl synthase domain-containing protein n=1 Tax=Apiospora phragmitis TaxID=2905665 RepID=A0ABR1V219_9PEZI